MRTNSGPKIRELEDEVRIGARLSQELDEAAEIERVRADQASTECVILEEKLQDAEASARPCQIASSIWRASLLLADGKTLRHCAGTLCRP